MNLLPEDSCFDTRCQSCLDHTVIASKATSSHSKDATCRHAWIGLSYPTQETRSDGERRNSPQTKPTAVPNLEGSRIPGCMKHPCAQGHLDQIHVFKNNPKCPSDQEASGEMSNRGIVFLLTAALQKDCFISPCPSLSLSLCLPLCFTHPDALAHSQN